jgi:parallel beta-helix repeat protein
MKKLTTLFLAGIMGMISVNHLAAQEKRTDSPALQQEVSGVKDIGATKSVQRHGVLLDSIQLNAARDPQGVVAVGDTIIIFSSDGAGNNYFDTYDFAGNHYREIKDTNTTGWGYRDLAYDGQYILASEDSTIRKIDPHTFAIVSTITTSFKLNRGLAYDPGENVIYSTDGGFHDHLRKLNAATGDTIKVFSQTAGRPYGIAFDPYTQPGKASLWFTYQKSFSTDPFMLHRVDTTDAHVNYVFDFKGQMPDSCRQGGLDIVNNPAAFPGKVVALATDQKYNKLYFIDISGAGDVLPAALEVTDTIEGWDAAGDTRGMAVNYPYLYAIEKGNLSLYDIGEDPGHPTHIKTDSTIGHRTAGYGGNKIFKYGDKLFITVTGPYPGGNKDDFTTIESYSITDPANPEYLNKLDVNLPIEHAAFYGNYIFLTHADAANVFSVVKWYADGTMELVHQYQITAKDEPAYPTDIQIDELYHLMFLSFHFTYMGNYPEAGISVYNILNVDDPQLLSGKEFVGDIPTALQILPDRRLAALVNHEYHSNYSSLYCYDYADLKKLNYRGLRRVSYTHIAFDVKMLSDNLLAVSVPDENVKTYYWDDQSTTFLDGPTAESDGGADIIPYSVPAAPDAFKNSQAPNPFNLQYFFALLRGYAPEYWWVTTGSEKTSIVKVVKQPKTSQKTLTMSIEPAEAANNGCSVTPSVGKHRYAKGTEINVYAHPNPGGGWYFTGWTGNVSGKDLIQHVVMDADKIAVAHFGKPELTVSGKTGSAWYCPRKILEDTSLMELPFLVCASDADDWTLSKIGFRHSGTGSPSYPDIYDVVLKKGNQTIFAGSYDFNNELNVTFTPPIEIGAGQCVPFKLIYEFGFEPDGGAPPANPIPYASDEVKTFHVETFGVVAKPVHLDGGNITGKAHNDTLTFARVRNSQGYLFPKIKDAVNSKTTRSGDTCLVCGGYYTESIQLSDTTKAVTLLSYDGPEKTVLYPDSGFEKSFIMLLPGHAPKTVEGFSMYCDSCTGIALRHAHESLIKNNTFYTGTGVSVYDSRNSKVESNFFSTNREAVKILKSQENEVFNNTAGVKLANTPMFRLWKSDRNNIHDNKNDFNLKNYGFWIKLSESSRNQISGHSLPEYYTEKHLIELKNRSFGNKIFDNDNFIVAVSKYSDSTNIYQNKLERVSITGYSSAGTRIERNTISGSDRNGIDLTHPGMKGMVFIKNNKISGHAGYGIYSDGVKTMIYGNEIFHNGYDSEHGVKKSGVHLENNKGSNLVRNIIFGNEGNGIDIDDSRDVLIQHNEISHHNTRATGGDNTSAGISIFYSPTVYAGKTYILDNYLAKNCTGVSIYSEGENNEPDVYMKGNTIENSLCLNTGIHVHRGVLHFTGNNVRNNNGNGILLQKGSVSTMKHNNISGNSEYGLNNQTENKITARSNYWGNSGGPGTGDIFGNVDYDNWLTAPFTLVAFPHRDTVYASPGTTDSTSLHIQNLNNLTDNLLVSINEEKGWIQAVRNRKIVLKDSMGLFYNLKYSVPAGTSPDESEKVYYKVTSETAQTVDSGWFVLSLYQPILATIRLNREKATVMSGDSLQFNAFAFDQYGHRLAIPLKWKASSGVVSDSGLFVAGNTEGETQIMVSDTAETVTGTARVYTCKTKPILTRLVVFPDSVVLKPFGIAHFKVKGYNQFGYPLWSENRWNSSDTAIDVDYNGVCQAKAYPGTYYVVVQDIGNTQSDTAVVIVEDVTGVEQTNRDVPSVKLSQNYPNPFHSKTQISFTLPRPADVWLGVYDINGREVSRLLKARKPAGTYRLTFDATNLPAGTYFYRLQAGGSVQVKKMILLK